MNGVIRWRAYLVRAAVPARQEYLEENRMSPLSLLCAALRSW